VRGGRSSERPRLGALGSAPWRRAPTLLLRHPVALLALTSAAVILVTVSAGFSLYVGSSASAAQAAQMAQRCPGVMGAWAVGAEPLSDIARVSASLARQTARALASARAPGELLGPAVTTLAIPVTASDHSGSASSPLVLYDRTGARSQVHVLHATGGDGLWLTDTTANLLGAHVGQSVRLGSQATVMVTAIYSNLQNAPRPLPRFWCSQETGNEAFIGSPSQDFPPPPLGLVDRTEFVRLARAVGASGVSFQWQRPTAHASTAADGAHLAAAEDVMTSRYPRAQARFVRGASLFVQPTDLAFVARRSDAIGRAVDQSEAPVAIAGLLVALGLVASAGSYWVDRRRLELDLLASRGVAPGLLGLKAVLEAGPSAVLGAAAGIGVARLLVWGLGPSTLEEPGAMASGVERGGLALAGGLAVLGLVAWVRLQPARRGRPPAFSGGQQAGGDHSVGRLLRRLPWELALLGTALFALSGLGSAQTALAPAGAAVASVGPLYLAFPMLFLAGITALVVRLGVISLPRLRSRSERSRPSVFLAVARLEAAPRVGALLLGPSALAVGMLIYAAALTATEQNTLVSKAETFVGSRSAVSLASAMPVPSSLAAQSTEVESISGVPVAGGTIDVLGIDPATFAAGAYWSTTFAGRPLGYYLGLLDRAPRSRGTLAVVVANGQLPSSASIQLQLNTGGVVAKRLRVLATVSCFPGTNGSDPLVVTDAASLNGLAARPEVWSRQGADSVARTLGAAGGTAVALVDSSTVLDTSSFLAVGWSFAFLQALGVLIGLIAVAGMLLYLETRQRSRLAGYVLAMRMGTPRRSHGLSVLVELTSTLLVGAVVGVVLGVVAAALVHTDLNPLPDLLPGTVLTIPERVIVVALAAAVVTAAGGSWWAQRAADRSSPALVLRGTGP
jgi:putative ABC transport system permease protein